MIRSNAPYFSKYTIKRTIKDRFALFKEHVKDVAKVHRFQDLAIYLTITVHELHWLLCYNIISLNQLMATIYIM